MNLYNMNVVENPKKTKPNEGLITNSIRLKRESFEEVIKKVQKLMAERDTKMANLNKQITNDVIKGVSYDDIKENEKYKDAAAKIAALEKDIYILRMMSGPLEEENHRAIRLIKQMFDNVQYNSNEIYKGLDYSLNAKQNVKSYEDMMEENTSEPTVIEETTTVEKAETSPFDVQNISKETEEEVTKGIQSAIADNVVDPMVIGSDEIESVVGKSLEDVPNPIDINDRQEEVNNKLNNYIKTLENGEGKSSTEMQAEPEPEPDSDSDDTYKEVSEEAILKSREDLGLPQYEIKERENAAKKFGKYDDNFRDTFGTEPVENIPYRIGLGKDENSREEPQIVPERNNSTEDAITANAEPTTVEEYITENESTPVEKYPTEEAKSLVLTADTIEKLKNELEADFNETAVRKAQLDDAQKVYEEETQKNMEIKAKQAVAIEERARVRAEIEKATESAINTINERREALRIEREHYDKVIDDTRKNTAAVSEKTAGILADIDGINKETDEDKKKLAAINAMLNELDEPESKKVK